ncbi:hypothetical protein N0V95_002796 [Ascochyta clinopodiicola]|nr:hypothetical protein N0V95_002796 [Ascochyta clinopodiicola]
MAARRTQFCSSLLVNAVLAAACQAYRGDFYISQAVVMAHNLRIFDPASVHSDPRLRRGREYTAWALWLWQVATSYYYRRAPFIKDPPAFAAPDPEVDSEWYGDIYVRYPLSPTITRMYLGHVIKATIDLRLIVNDLSMLQFVHSEEKDLSPQQVLDFKARLDALMKQLTANLAPGRISLPCHLNIHTEFYIVMHTLFQGQALSQKTSLASPILFDGRTAVQIRDEAYIRFETILRIRYLRHGFKAYDAWGIFFLVYLGNLALYAIIDEDPNLTNSHDASTQVDQPFDSHWPMPNVKVERIEEASMNYILKRVRKHRSNTEKAELRNVPSA